MSGIIGSKLNHRGSGLVGSLGTDGQHLLSAGAGKTNVFETVAAAGVTAAEGTAIRQDISTLALHSAVADNKAAYNLTSSFIDQFEDDTGIATETTGDRNSDEYWGSSTYATGSQALIDRTAGTAIGEMNAAGGLSAAFDGTISKAGAACARGDSSSLTGFIGKDWGAGVTRTVNGFKWQSSTDDGANTASVNTSGASLELYGNSSNDTGTATNLGGLTSLNIKLMDNDYSKLTGLTTSTAYRYHWIKQTVTIAVGITLAAQIRFYEDPITTTVNATGTLISAANTVTARTAVSGVALYKDASGTATIGTDLKIYFACDGGAGSPDWTEASYTAVTPVFSSGIKMLKLGKVTGLTSGTDVRYKAVWANQSSGSLETQLHGIGINY